MPRVDAVIGALRTVLKEAEMRHTQYRWKTRVVNRWINQLPGAWRGRWRHLKLRSDFDGEALRDNLISHVRATLAYLEINRDAIVVVRRSWWSSRKAKRVAPKEIASAAEKPETADQVETSVRPKWLN